MIFAIVGSRNFTDYDYFKELLVPHKKNIDMIVSGGAKGVDEMAYRYAIEKGITFVCHPPRPEEGYPTKFFRRNLRIVEHCEALIAFPMGKSTGTRHSISLAKKLGKKLVVYELEEVE
jgi:predicted Rossmann fold nucleotide-binding protein DprA/Smf involved in DNA uptake